MSEMENLKRIMLETTRHTTLFRQNTGMAWVGAVQRCVERNTHVIMQPGDVLLRGARPFHAGLVKGSSDLIGWTAVEVKPEHVGRKLGLFTAIEVKSDRGTASDDQNNFIAQVERAGGLAGVARTSADALKIITKLS